MNDNSCGFIWRCAKCSNHLSNVTEMQGLLKLQKKCPKCKSINELSITDKDIYIHCKIFDPKTNNYFDENGDGLPYG